MPEYNRKLSLLDGHNVQFGDPLLADIAGTSAFVQLSEPIDYALHAFNTEPFTYESNTFLPGQDGILTIPTQVPIVETIQEGLQILKEIRDIGLFDTILGRTGLGNLTRFFEPGTTTDYLKKAGIYSLMAIIGIVLIIFGLRELTK